jgi:membrane-bound serine protease (ClpP class)
MLVVIIIAGLVILLAALGVRAQFRKKSTGSEGIVGEIGTAKTDIGEDGGTVFIHGEYWNAISDTPIKSEQKVRVISVKAMVLKVEAVHGK